MQEMNVLESRRWRHGDYSGIGASGNDDVIEMRQKG